MNKPMSYDAAIEAVLAQMEGPVPFDEFIARVLELRPSQAKNPAQSVKAKIRYGWHDRLLVLDNNMVIPTHIVMAGVRFALRVSRKEAEMGGLLVLTQFIDYMKRGVRPEDVVFEDAEGNSLPMKLLTWSSKQQTIFGASTFTETAFGLSEWFKANRIQRDDFVLVTVIDWNRGHYRLDYEKARWRRSRRSEIAARNQALADVIFRQLEDSYEGRLFSYDALLPALARLPDPQGYPGDPWQTVVQADPRMITDGLSINYSQAPSPLQQSLMERADLDLPKSAQVRISREKAQRVYRFRVWMAGRKGLWREIEIQGRYTLSGFDDLLREEFNHDPSDHMSSFTKRVSRGKGKRPLMVELAVINPFHEGEGADNQIAALELVPGDELIYVYDFGAWFEYRIKLQQIAEPDPEAEYPRVVARNRPQYKYCQACAAEGRKVVAEYICVTCSEGQGPVYICDDHAVELHEDHWTDELFY
jgi:hypothetical protein